jgi:hypothetical protein
MDVPFESCTFQFHCTVSSEDDEEYIDDCPSTEPSSSLNFEVIQPLGGKYLRQRAVTSYTRYNTSGQVPDGVGTAFGQQKMQFNYGDVRTDFAFAFGPEVFAAEETVLADGDESLRQETGVFRGLAHDGSPAALPRLRTSAQLVLDINQTKQIAERAMPKNWRLGSSLDTVLLCADKDGRILAESSLTEAVAQACSGEAAFPLDIPLPDIELEPGVMTTAYVTVRITPLYYAAVIGRSLRLESWIASVEKVRVETEEHDYDSRTKASFRVRVEIELNTRRMYISSSFDIYDFCFVVGSWQGLWIFGGTVLSLWVTWVKPWGKLGPNDPLRAREAMNQRVENARLEKRTAYLMGRYETEAVGDETFEQYCSRLQRGEMAQVDVLQDSGVDYAEAVEDQPGETQLVAAGGDDKRTMDKTLVEMDEWAEKKLPAVHVAN